MKAIGIIPIAERKVEKRGIKRQWIEDTIRRPGQTAEGYGGRKVAQRKFFIGDKDYLLRVVYEETEDMYTVVTAYLASQVSRYWKEEK